MPGDQTRYKHTRSCTLPLFPRQVLSSWNFPCTSAAAQLLVGVLTIGVLWTPIPLPGRAVPLQLRAPPILSISDLKKLSTVASCLAAGHLLSTVAPAYGTVAFTNVVKTAEPLFTCAFSAIFLGQTFSLPVYLSLIPVIFGVCLATASEVSFSLISLISGLLSNVAFAMRAITAKSVMQGGQLGKNLTSQNLYGVSPRTCYLGVPGTASHSSAAVGRRWPLAIAKRALRQVVAAHSSSI